MDPKSYKDDNWTNSVFVGGQKHYGDSIHRFHRLFLAALYLWFYKFIFLLKLATKELMENVDKSGFRTIQHIIFRYYPKLLEDVVPLPMKGKEYDHIIVYFEP